MGPPVLISESWYNYQISLTIRDRLAKADPGNEKRERDLSVSQNKIRIVHRAMRERLTPVSDKPIEFGENPE